MSERRPPPSLRQQIGSGLAWKGASQVLLQGMRFALAISLARLLSPHEVGIAGMVIVFATFIIPFADFGLGAALVQRPTVTPTDTSTVFWASLAAGTAFAALGVATSPLLAAFYGEDKVAPLFAVLSLAFVITSLSATHRSLLVRELRFRDLELRLVASYAIAVPAAIGVAVLTESAWAFVTFELVTATASTALLWVMMPWRPRLAFSTAALRDFGMFGTHVLGYRLFLDLSQIVDKLVIGRWLGASRLGIYVLGSSLIFGPASRIAAPVHEVLFPAFSRVQGDAERVRDGWLRANRLVAAIAAPAMLGMIAVADDFVPVILGERWSDAVAVIQLLAIAGLLVAMQSLCGTVLQALDRPRTVMLLAALSLAATTIAVAVGVGWGLNGVAAAYALQAVLVTPVYVVAATRKIGASPRAVTRAVWPPLKAGLVMFAVLLIMDAALAGSASRVLRLLLETGVGTAVYVLALWRTSPDILAEVRRLRPRRGEA